MELRQIEKLMAAMGRTGTKKLVIKKKDFELELEQQSQEVVYSGSEIPAANVSLEERVADEKLLRRANEAFAKGGSATTSPPVTSSGGQQEKEVQGTFITSPMVGTFYHSPSPEEPPFVKVGDKVNEDTVVCIVEAMKVMNEVKAGVAGVVKEVLVENSHPVEFGTSLYRIE